MPEISPEPVLSATSEASPPDLTRFAWMSIAAGFTTLALRELPYCDYWRLQRGARA